MTRDLLFEVGTEELPAWYLTQARDAMVAMLVRALADAGLEHGPARGYATPRRLAVLVEGVAARSRERFEKRRGPAVAAAFDADGNPTRALLGFAAASGVEPGELVEEDTERGRYLFALQKSGGEDAAALLPPILAGLVRDLPAPRKMRWNEVETPFVRPVAWLTALLGSEVLPVEAAGLGAGRVTYGHRFLAPGAIELGSPAEYEGALREARVVASLEERSEATWREVCAAAGAEGLEPEADEALRAEVTGLVEYPVGILGGFDESYLELPEEVLTTVMIRHQRFFPVRSPDGRLAARFVGVSNNQPTDPGVVRAGYEQVLGGRLHDAGFFWQADRGRSLSQHAWALSGIAFQQELGSMADKVARVAEAVPTFAAEVGLGEDELAVLDQALPIFRADLATEMVYEFPELEGIMGRAYALAEGQSEAVAQALEDGVRPQGPDSPLPQTPAGALLAVADRFDKLLGFFALGKRPTGSADPFGLRRDAVGLARILNAQGWEVPPARLAHAAAAAYSGEVVPGLETQQEAVSFLWDRVAALLSDEGVPVQVVRAATADGPPVVTAARRAHLLAALTAQEEFPALAELYKRAANLAGAEEARQTGAGTRKPVVDPGLFEDPHEAPLLAALPAARRGVEELLARSRSQLPGWDLGRGRGGTLTGIQEPMRDVLSLKEPLDAFLDHVLVMVEDDAVRSNRLALLREVRDTLRGLGRLEELAGL